MAGETLTQGTKLQRGDGGNPETFTSIPGVTSITGLGSGQAAEIDNTDFDSTARESLQGLPDEGSLTVNLKRILGNAQQEGLLQDRQNQVLRNFKLLYRNGQWQTFSAFVTSFAVEASNPDEILRATVTLRISGPISAVQGP